MQTGGVTQTGKGAAVKKIFFDWTYGVLSWATIISFCVTAASAMFLSYAVRTALAAATLGYVSGVRFKKTELAAEYHLAYLQYFWATATAFCLWGLLSAAGVQLPRIPLLGVFALFPIISLAVIWRKREYKVVSPYVFVQFAFFVAVLLDHFIHA